ncbi:hypothetical protein QEH56_11640 [Pelagicoccus enzymogenes]|uniref:transporter n=1 Tax=Pelagicoccus enzymogenes TaxID=2773457 RepID=UPI00280DF11D|nr:transporter [Pelagicoccus enzymogenes]MDQ8198808.1 hypothetical protein [Pelagicoccus enzymogenes]
MNNTFFRVSTRTFASVTLALSLSATAFPQSQMSAAKSGRADSHAPIGVMGDHLHRGGEYMLSVRHMTMSMEGHRQGENSLTSHEVFAAGFSSAATRMDMDMSMVGFMYAPSDSVTLMLMTNYLEMDMDMVMNPHADMGGMHDDHGGHGMDRSHSTSGWGDTSLTALVKGWEYGKQKMHWNLGLSAPTGSVAEMMHASFQPYGMQLGSGTWDAKVGATYSGLGEGFGWGAQVLGTIRLEDEGESGFGRSDALEASVWGSWLVDASWSLSGRLKYSAEGPLDGHYNGPHAHSAPPHFQANYGGDILEAIVGLNYLWTDGALRGHRLALEYGQPIYQQLNGVGMNREDTLTLGWQYAW